MKTELRTGVNVTPEMVQLVKDSGHHTAILDRAVEVFIDPFGRDSDVATAYAYGAMAAVCGVVLSCPTGLDRLQQDYFWYGVEYGESLTD